MLVVKLEIWPFGEKAARRELGRIAIANVGGPDDGAYYAVDAKGEANDKLLSKVVMNLRHNRAEGAWALVYKALNALVHGGSPR